MATGTYAPYPRLQLFDNSGHPLASGTLETYAAGTSAALATYSDVGLLTANPTTLTLNSAGVPSVSGTEVAVFLSPGSAYKFIIKNSAGVTIATRDNITAVPASNVDVDVTGTAGEAISAGDAVYLSDGSGSLTAGRWYKADADTIYSSVGAKFVGMATAAVASGASGSFRVHGRMTGLSGLTAGTQYYASATAGALTATPPTNARLLGVADSTTTLLMAPNPAVPAAALAVCEGRLTATTATPVTTADVSGVTSVFFAPYRGNRISLFDGTSWNIRTFTEITISLVGLPASTPHDVFAYDNSGVVACETLAWTNATTRATALTTQNGVLVKTGATTRRYLGTVYINASGGQTDDTFAKRYIWNYYNRVPRPMRVIDATASWTYTTNAWQQANASATNQLDFVIGVAEIELTVSVIGHATNDNAAIRVQSGIGLDSTTATATGNLIGRQTTPVAAYVVSMTSFLRTYPAVGRHVATWLERSQGGIGTTTWYGTDSLGWNSGITGGIEG